MLPTIKASQIPEDTSNRWLIENIWSDSACGIICASPKSGKTFFCLSMAVSVASGKALLGKYEVPSKGACLLYCAEDRLSSIKTRLEGIAKIQGLSLEELDIHIITAPSFKLDSENDITELKATLAEFKPRLLILDCLVRLHNGSENDSLHLSRTLGKVRELQREFSTSIAIVHHSVKNAGNGRLSNSIRGSSELFAFVDSAVFLEKNKMGQVLLSTEQRSESSISGIPLKLETKNGLGLVIDETNQATVDTVASNGKNAVDRILDAMKTSNEPMTVRRIRLLSQMNTANAVDVVRLLESQGKVVKGSLGYVLAHRQ